MTGTAETEVGLAVKCILERIVDASEASSLLATEVGLEAENEDGSIVLNLELLSEDSLDISARDSAALVVLDVNDLRIEKKREMGKDKRGVRGGRSRSRSKQVEKTP